MQQRTPSDNRRGMWKGAVIGGAVGAAAALLLAPKSGKELRGDIRDRYADVQDRTKRLLSDVGSKAQDVAKQAGTRASELADKTRSAVTAAKDEIKSWKDEQTDGGKPDSKIN